MDEIQSEGRYATAPATPSDPENMAGSEPFAKSATMFPRTPKTVSAREKILETPTKAEEDDLRESDAAAWPASRAGSTPRTPWKRPRPYYGSLEDEEEDKFDVPPKHEASGSDEFPSANDICSPSKRHKYVQDNRQASRGQPNLSRPQMNKNSVEFPSNDGSDFEESEECGSSDNDNNEDSFFVAAQVSTSRNKTKATKILRQKPARNSEEWFNRPKNTKLKSTKSQSRRTFAQDGAEDKIQSMMNHDPLAGKNSERDRAPTQFLDVSNKSEWFKLLSNLNLSGDCRGDPNSLKVASESFGLGKIKLIHLENDKSLHKTTWLLKGMKTPLWHHQLIGVHWMMSREFSKEEPKGGIVADAMGLGKTIEVLAAIVANPRPKGAVKKKIGPTLIVCPACIIDQWQSEIGKHLEEDKYQNVVAYKAGSGPTKANLMGADIVLASYTQLRISCPWPPETILRRLRKEATSKGNKAPMNPKAVEDWVDKHREKQGGLLHKISWYRVVLDEAQNIKNEAVRTSHAANALLGQHRWAMSGTPMMNRREELYPYFRFLKDPTITDLSMQVKFTREFCEENNKRCDERINEVLGRIILRRTMTDKILGREIVELPPFTKKNDLILFNQATEILYQAVEQRFRELVTEAFKNDDPRKKMQYSIVALLRLRQFTAHPLIIEPQMEVILPIMFHIKELKEIQKKMNGADPQLHHRIDLWIRDLECGRESPKSFKFQDTDACGICDEIEIDDAQQVRARSEWLEDVDAGKSALPQSTKLASIRKLLLEWRKGTRLDKTIIFVQWKAMILLIGMMLEEDNFHFVYYTGDMSKRNRANALDSFENMKEVTVMIMGLKVGGVGLNITCANRAIMVDLWWNQAIEMQANARIYRIGQPKETHFRREVVRRSADIRLALTQLKKNALIVGTSKVLGDHGQIALDTPEILALLEESDVNMAGSGVYHNPGQEEYAEEGGADEPMETDKAGPEPNASEIDSDDAALFEALSNEYRGINGTADNDYEFRNSNVDMILAIVLTTIA
ncbi:SNF2 family domain-containing protein [Botrytis cinerea]